MAGGANGGPGLRSGCSVVCRAECHHMSGALAVHADFDTGRDADTGHWVHDVRVHAGAGTGGDAASQMDVGSLGIHRRWNAVEGFDRGGVSNWYRNGVPGGDRGMAQAQDMAAARDSAGYWG